MKTVFILTASLAIAATTAALQSAQTPAPSAPAGMFTEEQAARGRKLYDSRCVTCHGDKLVAEDPQAADLTGFTFHLDWHGKTLAERLDKIRTTMPPGKSGMLTDQEYADVLAFILSFNGYPAGKTELTPNMDALKEITLVPSGSGKDQ
jgi:mono/diheme cytochrome c family protein